MEQVAENRCFGGRQLRYRHRSQALGCDMYFSIFLPPQAEQGPVPVLYWLSGLTCTDENFVHKAGAQRYAAQYGMAVVTPDTSPRGEGIVDDPEGAWDFGLGAGFYLNATEDPWAAHYNMHDYVASELFTLVGANFPVDSARAAISGHSMGGHGALNLALKSPGRYKSVSAFAPICSPMNCSWGEKAFSHYLGDDQTAWENHDSCVLLGRATEQLPLLVDQGEADEFLVEQLKPELLRRAADASGYPLQLRMQPGYDHSYFFIASFIGEHIAFHAESV